jgi:hypothetical protein
LDAVWREARSLLTAQGIEPLPAALSHDIPYPELYAFKELTLSQCCGLDLFRPHTSNIVPIAAPDMTALDVPKGYYFSHIVTGKSPNMDSPRVVINNRSSHSGHTTIRVWLTAHGYGEVPVFESGSHAQSLDALREGRADLAAIDALSWLHLDSTGIAIIDKSDPALAPPFIVGNQSTIPKEALIEALNTGFECFGTPVGIGGVLPVAMDDYVGMANTATEQGIL